MAHPKYSPVSSKAILEAYQREPCAPAKDAYVKCSAQWLFLSYDEFLAGTYSHAIIAMNIIPLLVQCMDCERCFSEVKRLSICEICHLVLCEECVRREEYWYLHWPCQVEASRWYDTRRQKGEQEHEGYIFRGGRSSFQV